MTFTNPSYLWALWGLLIPLAIHLWSKREARTIKVGSVKFLDESHSRQSRRLQINEWLLLALRMGIVALVVLVMAGPHWRTKGKADRVSYLVEPSLTQQESLSAVLDSLSAFSTVRLLQEGFPLWEAGMEVNSTDSPPYWQLVQKMDSLLQDSLVVFAQGHFRGIKGKRPTTHKKIHWLSMDNPGDRQIPLLAMGDPNEPTLVSLVGNGQGMGYNKEKLDRDFALNSKGDSLVLGNGDSTMTVAFVPPTPITVHIHFETASGSGQAYLRAALSALSTHMQREIKIQEFSGDTKVADSIADLNIWLREDPPGKVQGRWLIYVEDPLATHLIEPKGEERFHLTSTLTTENTVAAHFVHQLLPLLQRDDAWAKRVGELDFRQMDPKELEPRYMEPQNKRERTSLRDLLPWLLIALGLLMGTERLLSRIKGQ